MNKKEVDTARWKYWKAWRTISDARLKVNSGHTKHLVQSTLTAERFCSAKGIGKHPKVIAEELDAAVGDAVSKVS